MTEAWNWRVCKLSMWLRLYELVSKPHIRRHRQNVIQATASQICSSLGLSTFG